MTSSGIASPTIGRKIKIPQVKEDQGLERIILVSRSVKEATPFKGDYKITFEEEPEKTYLWSDVRNYNKQKKCNKEHCTLEYDTHIERYVEVTRGHRRVIEPAEDPGLYGIKSYNTYLSMGIF